MRPAPTASGSPVLSTTYGAVYQHPRTWTILLASLFDTPLPRFPVLSCTESIRTFTFRTLMRRLTSVFPLHSSPFLAFSRHVCSVAAALFTHTNAQKHTKTQKTLHITFPFSVVSIPPLALRGFLHEPPAPPSSWTGRTPPTTAVPPPHYAFPCIRSTKPPALLQPALAPPPVASLRPPVGIRSLYVTSTRSCLRLRTQCCSLPALYMSIDRRPLCCEPSFGVSL